MARLTGAMFEEELREWAPMTDLLTKIPTKVLIGLFQHDVKLTCVDATKEMIALGTNMGVVYLYDRRKKNLQRLRSDNNNYTAITAIKLISSVDYMVASGAKDGKVTIYQIPKEHAETIPDILKPKNLHAERYVVADMHKGPISALEWSKNAMKLFSGDKNGSVILTEFDYQMHLSKSVEIMNDTYEVVQLSYCQQILLVSTIYRSIVCQNSDKWVISQVGKKVRKTLGHFGGVFYQKGICAKDIVLYCTRPGLRLWESNLEGAVQNTLIFKDILTSDCPDIPIINPISMQLRHLKPKNEATFGALLPFHDDLLVTTSSDAVYVINPNELKIIGIVQNLRNILDVCCNKDEIFILEGERMLLRVAFKPDLIDSNNTSSSSNNKFPNTKNPREISNNPQTYSVNSTNLAQTLSKTHQSNIPSISNAEEALEAPQRVTKHITTETRTKLDMYNQISTQDYDETILFKRGKRKKHSRASLVSNQDTSSSTMTASMSSNNSNSSDDREVVTTSSNAMTVSTVSVLADRRSSTTSILPDMRNNAVSVLPDMRNNAVSVYPDMRSPESLRYDIEAKERMLADILHFDVKIDISRLDPEEPAGKEVNRKSEVKVQRKEIDISNVVKRSEPKDIVPTGRASEAIEDSFDSSVDDVSTHRIRLKSENDTLLCRNVPKDWDLSRVLLNKEESDVNISSFSDWEVL